MADPDTSVLGQPHDLFAVLKKLETEVGQLAILRELLVGYLAYTSLVRGNLDPARAQRAGLYLSDQLSQHVSRLQQFVAAAHDAGVQAAPNREAERPTHDPSRLSVRRA